MKKKIGRLTKILAFIVLVLGIALGAVYGRLYLKETTPSARELWRIYDSNLEEPMIVNNLLLFKGTKGEYLHSWCEYVYAVDKNTGKPVWSLEDFTTQYCDQSLGPVYTAVILMAQDNNAIFVSSSYWITDDEQGYVLYAISESTGELLWKVDGYAGYPYNLSALLDYTLTDTNYIFVASNEGSFSAIDSITGKEVWKQKVPKVKFENTDDILIEYHNQVVYYYHAGNQTLIAFDANNGTQIWSVSEPHYAGDILFSSNMIYLDTCSSGCSTSFITALDAETGNQIWELAFESTRAVEIIENEIYIWAGYNHTMSDLVVVNKTTGEIEWKFNGDYSHGDISYIIEGNVIYVGTKDGLLFLLNRKTGEVTWQVKSSGLPYCLQIDNSTLVVAYKEKYVSGFDTETGKQKWILDVGMDTSRYPWDFTLASDGVIYISSTINQMVYAIDIGTGKILWTWNHYHPRDDAYMLKALDDNVLYVDQDSRFLGYDWFFALKAKP